MKKENNFFGLKANPFERDFTFSFDDYKRYPFIQNVSIISNLKNGLTWNSNSTVPYFVKIVSDKGAGKSTLLFFLQEQLEKLDNPNIKTCYLNYVNQSYLELIKTIVSNEKFCILENGSIFERLKDFSKDNKVYLFLDFQDSDTNKDSIKKIEEILLKFFNEYPNISIIISFNSSQEKEMESISIMGKFKPYTMKSFDLESTKELIRLRLKCFREEHFKGNSFYPLDNVVDLIYEHSGGNPRKIISICNMVLSELVLSQRNFSREEFLDLFRNNFAENVLEENIKDDLLRQNLLKLYNLIKNKFEGQINKQTILTDYISKTWNWSNPTIIKRIKYLQKLNLISITKSNDGWTNNIRIIE